MLASWKSGTNFAVCHCFQGEGGALG